MEGRLKRDDWSRSLLNSMPRIEGAGLLKAQPFLLFCLPVSFPSALSEDGKQLALPSKPSGPPGPRPEFPLPHFFLLWPSSVGAAHVALPRLSEGGCPVWAQGLSVPL